MHLCLCHCHDHHCTRGQGMADNAKAPLSMQMSPFVNAHHRLRQCCDCHCLRGQGTANDAKVLSSAQSPLLLLCAVVCTAAILAIAREGKEQPMMPPWHRLLLHCHHHRPASGQGMANNGAKAPSSALPPSSSCTIIHAAATDGVTGESEERPKMPRHRCPCRRHRCHRAP